jgi:hypothetical protein
MTFDPVIGDRHGDAAFQIFDRSDGIVVGESVIGGCHSGVADCCSMGLEILSVSAWNSAMPLSWTGKPKNRMKWKLPGYSLQLYTRPKYNIAFGSGSSLLCRHHCNTSWCI